MPVVRTSTVGFPPQVAATSTFTSTDQQNNGCSGIVVYLKTTAIGTGSITLTIQGKDKQSGDYYTLLAGAAVTTNTVNRYTVAPRLTPVLNVTANDVLPETWRVQIVANNANPTSYTVGASLAV